MDDIKDQFKNALGRWVSGVAVILAASESGVKGITVSAFMSGSLEPPLICFAINRDSEFNTILGQAEQFTLNILNSGQSKQSDFWAGWSDNVEDSLTEKDGLPYINPALAQLTLRHYARHDCGDHWLYISELETAESFENEPLIYYRGAYGMKR